MKLIYSSKTEKDLKKLAKRELKKIFRKINALKKEPFLGKKLKGELKGLYSFKSWPYRIIYKIDKDAKIIYIVAIQHRQSVYR